MRIEMQVRNENLTVPDRMRLIVKVASKVWNSQSRLAS